MTFGIGLGSNVGDRLGHLRAGVSFLKTVLRPGARVSSIYETAPIDCPPGSTNFYNAVVEGEFDGGAGELLKLLKEFETTRGERPPERNAPRALDLDLLYGEKPLREAGLELPHPRLGERRFVLEPLSEIRPRFRLPGQELTVEQMLEPLRHSQEVRRVGKIP